MLKQARDNFVGYEPRAFRDADAAAFICQSVRQRFLIGTLSSDSLLDTRCNEPWIYSLGCAQSQHDAFFADFLCRESFALPLPSAYDLAVPTANLCLGAALGAMRQDCFCSPGVY